MHDRKWQYKVETIKMSAFSASKNDAVVQDSLNRFGMEGWELVSSLLYGTSVKLFFKR